MTLLCSTLYVTLLYSGTITTPWHTAEDISSPAVEAQTCIEGFGARISASPHYVQIGPQFGYTIYTRDRWRITLQTHGGFGYSNTQNPTTHIRQVTLLNFGVAAIISYDRYSVHLGYDHMSRGRGEDATNAGQDLWLAGIGYQFQ